MMLKSFPGKLSEREQRWLFYLLPENRRGYNEYRKKIENMLLFGYGRFGIGNYVLGCEGTEIDLSAPSAPILAAGTLVCEDLYIDLAIHEEFEDQIEIDIDPRGTEVIPEELDEKSYWTYSEWLPGKKAPGDNSEVREIHLIKNSIVIAISPSLKRVWVYEESSGINHLIPVSNFYNEIMMIKNERDPEIAFNSKRLFSYPAEFSDEEIGQGFLMYNKYLNKIKLDYSLFKKEEPEKKNSFLSFFKRRKN